jgi:diguanylate cyclase
MTSLVRRGILIRFALVCVLSLVGALAAAWGMIGAVEDTQGVTRTHEILAGIERTLSLLKDAESGQRGYLLTGESRYLKPYRAAATTVGHEVDRLAALTEDDPQQQAQLARLSGIAEAKLAELRETIAAYDRSGSAAALAIVRTERGQRLMDQVRGVAAAMRVAEEERLSRRSVRAVAATQLMVILAGGAATANLLILWFAYRLLARELERRLAAESRLEALAATDALTGLANRRAVGEALDMAVSHAARGGSALSVVLLDVDGFKSFNDTFGHPAGDAVLRDVSAVLRSAVRGHDVVGRYGGEEFLAVFPGADAGGAVRLAERIRAAVAARDWPLRPVTISLGVATLAAEAPDPAALVAAADRALYASKRRGRDRVTHCRDLDDGGPATPTPACAERRGLAPAAVGAGARGG